MTLEQQLAEAVALEIASALEPLQRKLAEFEASAGQWVTKAALDQAHATIAELQTRLVAAESRALVPGPIGPAGPAGRDGVNGKDGRDGLDGKDGAQGPQGLAGKDGRHGTDGKDGAPGLSGKAGAQGLSGPAGRDGVDGRNGIDGKDGAPGLAGKDGRDGLDGKAGPDGLNGKDGVGVAGALLTKDGALVLTLSDGSVRELGLVRGEPGLDGKDGAPGLNGKDGRDGMPGVPGRPGEPGADGAKGLDGKSGLDGLPGRDGKDGLGFDDLQLTFDEQKGYQVQFVRGQERKAFPVAIPFDAGVWQAGRLYPKGAGVTFKGSFSIAQEPTRARPGDETPESKAWRLAVRAGKDGKPGAPGRDGIDA